LTAAEAQTVASTNPIALRVLLLPNFDGVANSFSKLLLRVVRRCKWNGQVEGRVLHACEALGVREGRPILIGSLAKRLRGFGLAWHSFTIEECQAFVEQELDTDEDGRVGVPDIFAFLCTLKPPQQAQRASRITTMRMSRPRTARRIDFCRGVLRPRETRRQAAVAAGLFATRNFPRGLQQKLLTAARQARSCGVNVLKVLQEGVCRSSFSSSSSRPSLGAEATCFFFQNIGVHYEDFGGRNGSSGSSFVTRKSSGQGADLARSRGLEDVLYRRSGRNEFDVRLPEKPSPQEGKEFPESGGELLFHGHTRAEPWSAFRDQCQVRGGAETREEQSSAQWDASATRSLRHPPDPTSRSRECRTHTLESQRQHGFPHPCLEKEDKFMEGVVDAGKASYDRSQKENDMGVSQRLRLAAEDLKRMQAEYVALEQQVHGGEQEAGSMRQPHPSPPLSPPPTTTQKTNDDPSENATSTTTSRPYNDRPRNSFCHGHSNPRNEGAYHHFFRRGHGEQHLSCSSTGYEEARGSAREREERAINAEEEGGLHHHHGEGQLSDNRRGMKQEYLSSWLRPSSQHQHEKARPPHPVMDSLTPSPSVGFTLRLYTHHRYRSASSAGWPQHAPDTRRCRALLLMAAQGKTSREEVFDPATPRNGFSRIQKHQAFGFGEEKVGMTV
ncbi:unnamed protein product, partial [Hapterophycus canaliculatus]